METVSLFSMFVFFSLSIFWYHILTGLRHLIMDFLHIGETINGSDIHQLFVIFIWLVSLGNFYFGIYSYEGFNNLELQRYSALIIFAYFIYIISFFFNHMKLVFLLGQISFSSSDEI